MFDSVFFIMLNLFSRFFPHFQLFFLLQIYSHWIGWENVPFLPVSTQTNVIHWMCFNMKSIKIISSCHFLLLMHFIMKHHIHLTCFPLLPIILLILFASRILNGSFFPWNHNFLLFLLFTIDTFKFWIVDDIYSVNLCLCRANMLYFSFNLCIWLILNPRWDYTRKKKKMTRHNSGFRN